MAEREAWLRGPVAHVPPLLQPVAHALIQARDEVHGIISGFDDEQLWLRPAGIASAGFHLQHLAGVVDRLFTYARGEPLTAAQLTALSLEGQKPSGPVTGKELAHAFDAQVEAALVQLRATREDDLLSGRHVGRAKAPSTVIGLLVHAAEHANRHVGQLLVTVRVLASTPSSG